MSAPAGHPPPNIIAMGPTNLQGGDWTLPLSWTIRAIAIVVVALRIYARNIQRNTAGWDDAAMVLAMLLSIGDGVANTFQAKGIQSVSEFGSTIVASELLNFCSLFFMRLSICIFVLRLLPPTQKYPQWATYFAIFLNLVGTVISIAVFSGDHQNFADGIAAIDTNYKTLEPAFLAAGVLSVIVDFIVVSTPIFIVKDLQMNRKTKAGIIVIMALSVITAACSIGKLVTVEGLIQDPITSVKRIELFSNFEENGGIVFGSMPALRQLYVAFRAKNKTKTKKTGSSPYYGHHTPVTGHPIAMSDSQKELVGKIGKQTSIDVELTEIMPDEEKSIGMHSVPHSEEFDRKYGRSQVVTTKGYGDSF